MLSLLFVSFALADPELYFDNGTLTISSSGKLIPELITASYNINLITNIIFDENAQIEIGDHAFLNFKNLVSIHLSRGVSSIQKTAFRYCSSLTIITVDINNPHFAVENSVLYNIVKSEIYKVPVNLEIFTIPNTVSTLKDHSFHLLKKMDKLIIPRFVNKIEEGAFYDANIDIIEFENGSALEKLEPHSFSYSNIKQLILSDTLKEIENNSIAFDSHLFNIAFKTPRIYNLIIHSFAIYGSKISFFAIPDNSTVEGNAFNPSINLNRISIGRNCNLDANSFAGCPNIQNFDTQESIGRENGFIIHNKTLLYVSKGTSDYFNFSTVNSFPNPGFQYSSNLTRFESKIPDGYTEKDGVIYNNDGSKVIAAAGGLTYIKLSDNVRILGPYCFTMMSKLQTLEIKSEVISISEYAFYQCHIQKIEFKEVDSIDYGAFEECYATNITFTSGPKTVAGRSFKIVDSRKLLSQMLSQ